MIEFVIEFVTRLMTGFIQKTSASDSVLALFAGVSVRISSEHGSVQIILQEWLWRWWRGQLVFWRYSVHVCPQRVAACCSVLQRVAADFFGGMACIFVRGVCCSVFQCVVAVRCCSVLQRVVELFSVSRAADCANDANDARALLIGTMAYVYVCASLSQFSNTTKSYIIGERQRQARTARHFSFIYPRTARHFSFMYPRTARHFSFIYSRTARHFSFMYPRTARHFWFIYPRTARHFSIICPQVWNSAVHMCMVWLIHVCATCRIYVCVACLIAVCCSVLQCVAVCYSVSSEHSRV